MSLVTDHQDAGWLYLLTNDQMPDLVKVGKTDRNPEERAAELSKPSGVPGEYLVAECWRVINSAKAENLAHDVLRDYRVPGSEHFKLPKEKAIVLINEKVGLSQSKPRGAHHNRLEKKERLEKELEEKLQHMSPGERKVFSLFVFWIFSVALLISGGVWIAADSFLKALSVFGVSFLSCLLVSVICHGLLKNIPEYRLREVADRAAKFNIMLSNAVALLFISVAIYQLDGFLKIVVFSILLGCLGALLGGGLGSAMSGFYLLILALNFTPNAWKVCVVGFALAILFGILFDGFYWQIIIIPIAFFLGAWTSALFYFIIALQPPSIMGDGERTELYNTRNKPHAEGLAALPQSYEGMQSTLGPPKRVSDIALQPGEKLTSVSAGDTVSGAGDSERTHVLVKPFAPGLKTNLVITTDRRAYRLQLESTEKTSMAAISWTYPQDRITALRRRNAEADAAMPVASNVALENLRFRYAISGDDPPWRPLRAFDDGRKVYIEFPRRIDQGEAPPLFVVGADGGNQLVNYRMRGNHYIVDRLFTAAELRLGAKPRQVVRISRTDGAPRRNAVSARTDR